MEGRRMDVGKEREDDDGMYGGKGKYGMEGRERIGNREGGR